MVSEETKVDEPVDTAWFALPALYTAFAAVAIASGLNRKQSAQLIKEIKGLPFPDSVEQAWSQLTLAIDLVKNRE